MSKWVLIDEIHTENGSQPGCVNLSRVDDFTFDGSQVHFDYPTGSISAKCTQDQFLGLVKSLGGDLIYECE